MSKDLSQFKSSFEEIGANSLFLSIGTLKFIDKDKTRLAPIMLFPVSLSRASARSGYQLSLLDEDPSINVSLVEFLRSSCGISLDGFDPLPMKESEVDVRLVLNTFRRKVMYQPGWEVLESGTLGVFSFSQFVMWNDIRNHEDELRKSKIVSSLLDGKLTWTPEPMNQEESVDPTDLLLPEPADQSQMYAIRKALDGQSFVLHGPPGTGKSQTITLIIANALAQGKKVLFVSEKMAALEVVENRLKKLGIDPFCLEVHSAKATKNHVLDQVSASTKATHTRSYKNYRDKSAEDKSVRGQLDSYARQLQQRNAADFSLRDLICEYVAQSESYEPLPGNWAVANSFTSREDYYTKMDAAENLIRIGKTVAPTNESPLSAVTGTVYRQAITIDLPALLDSWQSELEAFSVVWEKTSNALHLTSKGTLDDITALLNEESVIKSVAKIPTPWVVDDDLRSLTDSLESLVEQNQALSELRNQLLQTHTESFFSMDIDDLKSRWVEANSKNFFFRKKAVKKVLIEMSLGSKGAITAGDVSVFIDELAKWNKASSAVEEGVERQREALRPFRNSDGTISWKDAETALSNTKKLQADGSIEKFRRIWTGDIDETLHLFEELSEGFAKVNASRAKVEEYVGQFALDEGAWIDSQLEACRALRDHLGELREWMNWNKARAEALGLGLHELIDYLGNNKVESDTFERYKCGITKSMVRYGLDSSESMNSFTGSRLDGLIEQYARIDTELQELSKEELRHRIASHIPNLVEEATKSTEAATLQRSLRNRKRSVTVRSIFRDCGNILLSLCPCMLMSPLSVSQYLAPGKELFDLVIFDEASQLQTCKAVGALARGKEAIIVGDPKQMPPTSFFKEKIDDEEYDQVADLESVLDDCIALNMPQTYLRWHYRSHHESLISFSNREFYDGSMFTFPSADDGVSRVRMKKVNGIFERGASRRYNLAEAKAIVNEIEQRYEQGYKGSIGIVTFNIPQQKLIQDLFEQACIDNSGLEKWANKRDEPLFIKNLENVQGDERDVILFSITYAPDENGTMSMNFGPINREGGYRRLNVAVTRARTEMVVFSSISYTDIDLNRTSSRGASALRHFLEYAENGHFTSLSNTDVRYSEKDAIGKALGSELEKAGYLIHYNVGTSQFRVDLGVVDPNDENRYLAAILLDGRSYQVAKTTRDREIAQRKLLENLGWKVIRVWAIDWWENSDKVVHDVEAWLSTVLEDAKKEPRDNTFSLVEEGLGERLAENDESTADIGREASERKIAARAPAPLGEVSAPAPRRKGTSAPAPLNKEKRRDHQKRKPASRVKEHSENLVTPSNARAAAKHYGSTVSSASKAPTPRRLGHREIEYVHAVIPPVSGGKGLTAFMARGNQQIADVMNEIIAVEAPIYSTSLFKKASQVFGVNSSNKSVMAKCQSALLIAHAKRISADDNVVVWSRDQDPKSYQHYRVPTRPEDVRKIWEVPYEEVAAAALDVLEDFSPSLKDSLVSRTLETLGFSDTSSAEREYALRGISRGVQYKWFYRYKDVYAIDDSLIPKW
ncbi:MAG: AAA domain-containing protein [Tractidigestivibacter sp.]|uniref:AAA domain-containing protein n=1 Tax=Tractidigestivibacter sp. TaxID=2847320 RepID=UPI003D94B33C